MRKRIISVIGAMLFLLMSAHACAEMTTLKGSVWHSEDIGWTLVFKGDDCVEWTDRRQQTIRGKYFSRGSLVAMSYYENGEVMLSSEGRIEGEEMIFPGLAQVFQLVSYEEDYGIDAEAVEDEFFEDYWYLGYDRMSLYEADIVADDGYIVRLHRNGTAEIVGFNLDVYDIEKFDPAQEYFGYQVAKIGRFSFSGARFSSVVIPDGIKCIGEQAFSTCSNLQQVVLPEGLEEIEDSAFAYCEGLREVVWPDGLKKIGASAFSGCLKLRNLELPGSLTTIGEGAFSYCESIALVTIPDGVRKIEPKVFSGCSSLKKIDLPERLESIGNGAFSFCAALEKIELPDGLSEIGETAFAISGLKEVVIPDSVASIGIGAFMKCDNLTKVSIGSGISSLPRGSFANNSALQEIEIPANIQSIVKRAFDNTGLKKVVFHGACRIEDEAFKSCPDLESIVSYGDLSYSQASFPDSPLLTITREERAQFEIMKVEEGRELPMQANWERPYVTLLSAEDYKEVDHKLWNKVIRVQDVVGGWFKVVVPKDGDCYISVMANELERDSFNIEAYLYGEHIGSMRFEKSDAVQTWVVKGLHEGDELCWWDNDNSGRWWTLQEPFKMMVELVW